MDLSGFVVQGLNGLAGASSLFLVAAGLSLIFGVTRIVNFAHGSFFMLGIYLAYTLVEHIGRAWGLGTWYWPLMLLALIMQLIMLLRQFLLFLAKVQVNKLQLVHTILAQEPLQSLEHGQQLHHPTPFTQLEL